MRRDGGTALSLLELDPDLARATEAGEPGVVRRAALVRTVALPAGTALASWPGRSGFGLFVADGIMLRRVRVGRARSVEFVGPGDVIQPWLVTSDQLASIPVASDWSVLDPVTLGVLDEAFVERVARVSPSTLSRLFERSIARTRRLTYFLAVHSLVHVGRRGRRGRHGAAHVAP